MARFSCCRCTCRCWKPRIPSPTAVYTVFSTLLEMSSVDGRGTPRTLAEAGGGRGGGSAAGNGPFATLRVVVESEEQPLASPPVLVVVVTHGLHADRFEVLLGALAEQDYPELSVLVVDAAGERPRRPGPCRPARRPGAARARSRGLRHGCQPCPRSRPPPGPPGRVLLVLPRRCPPGHGGRERTRRGRHRVGRRRRRAQVRGPGRPPRLLHVGLGVDRVGTTMPLVERRELDQGQHDGVREVFAFPGRVHAGACGPVRSHGRVRRGDRVAQRRAGPVLARPVPPAPGCWWPPTPGSGATGSRGPAPATRPAIGSGRCSPVRAVSTCC